MDRNVAFRSNDELDVSPVDTELEVARRSRIALRDRLIKRVFEEEFLGLARAHGEDALYLVGFETDPMRIWNRLGLEYRSSVIRDRIDRINKLGVLALTGDERMVTSVDSNSFQDFLISTRHDWSRGKIKDRAERRRRRELMKTPDEEDLLWRQICSEEKKQK